VMVGASEQLGDEFAVEAFGERDDAYYMAQALKQAALAFDAGEVPVGAVIVRQGKIIGRSFNQVEMLKDGTAHAEMLALTQASAAIGDWRLNECTMYVTKEPCPMCAGALVNCRIGRLVFGCGDARGGATGGTLDLAHWPGLLHQFDCTSGVLGEESLQLLKDFFKQRRMKN